MFPVMNLLHSPFASILGPNIRLRILFSNTLSLRFSVNARDHVKLHRKLIRRSSKSFKGCSDMGHKANGNLQVGAHNQHTPLCGNESCLSRQCWHKLLRITLISGNRIKAREEEQGISPGSDVRQGEGITCASVRTETTAGLAIHLFLHHTKQC